jgi:hypothetical protein
MSVGCDGPNVLLAGEHVMAGDSLRWVGRTLDVQAWCEQERPARPGTPRQVRVTVVATRSTPGGGIPLVDGIATVKYPDIPVTLGNSDTLMDPTRQ